MSLENKIALLRAEINATARSTSSRELPSEVPQAPTASVENRDQQEIESLIKLINDALDELPKEIEKYPRLTAIGAFGVGLAFGVILDRRFQW
ncbi:hypothetical protein [Hyphomicrobium sp. DY-1]|uniref:hypothetical protein n=1 Tax=Hyphomicrobium sp. DY-1 TaxID=3075650 RepID=UPI0039C110DD